MKEIIFVMTISEQFLGKWIFFAKAHVILKVEAQTHSKYSFAMHFTPTTCDAPMLFNLHSLQIFFFFFNINLFIVL